MATQTKPNIKEFMDATGADFLTASNTLYGNIGANIDARDWNAIMSSSNPLSAATAATAAMYSDPTYQQSNTANLVTQGYEPAQAYYTYGQMNERVGANYTPTADEVSAVETYFRDNGEPDYIWNVPQPATQATTTTGTTTSGTTAGTTTGTTAGTTASTTAGTTTTPNVTTFNRPATLTSAPTLNDVINAISNPYSVTPDANIAPYTVFNGIGGAYGAGRFIDPNFVPVTSRQVNGFTPGVFGGAGGTTGGATTGTTTGSTTGTTTGSTTGSTIGGATGTTTGSTTGTSGGGSTSNTTNTNASYDPYAGLFTDVPSWLSAGAGLLTGLPIGPIIGALQGYQDQQAINNLVTGLTAYGLEGLEQQSPGLAALLGTIGLSTDQSKQLEDFAKNFTSIENLYGYMDVATNPVVNQIFQDQYVGEGINLTADQLGAIGNSIVSRVHSYVADGMPLAAAEAQAAKDFGSTSIAPMADYDPMGDFIAQLNDPFSDVSLGLDTMTSNTGAQGTNLGNGLVAYSDGSMRDAMTGAVVGGVVTDSQGNAITSTDGTAVGWGVGVSPTYSGGSSNSGGGGYNYSGAADTGMATNDAGQSVSNDASIAAQDAASFGDSDSGSDSGGGGGGGSGRYCCSRMVHHGLWDVNHEFARLTVWSRKQPRWWRSGYPVWGKIIAKHLLGKVGFWTDVMQAFYDNKVRHKPRTWKSTLGELVIFPGAFVCGMIWREVPQGARLADPKEFA